MDQVYQYIVSFITPW